MNQETPKERPSGKRGLSEDWVSVLVGLAVVAVVALLGLSSIPWPLFGVFK